MLVRYRRIREGKTDYKRRLKLLLSKKPRLVIRKSNRNVSAQIIAYDPKGDIVLAAADSRELIKFGWKCSRRDMPASYLTGLLIGKKAQKAGIKEAVLDTGLYTSIKGSIIYSVLKGSLDAGLKVPYTDTILPSNDRIEGKHIIDNDVTKFVRFDPKAVVENFKHVKEKVLNG